MPIAVPDYSWLQSLLGARQARKKNLGFVEFWGVDRALGLFLKLFS